MESRAKDYKDLEVWKKAHQFVVSVYKATESFPKSEIYGLTSQFRRAAVSIPANIAEGFAKKGKPDKLRFYNISQGSLNECDYYLIISKDLSYINDICNLNSLLNEVAKMLTSYCKSIKASI
ncbi:MAG: four helix bundle protein [Melioribacteraceae bacterium]|nr:four helix bundle protein [Melioribacteraceae bacterium]